MTFYVWSLMAFTLSLLLAYHFPAPKLEKLILLLKSYKSTRSMSSFIVGKIKNRTDINRILIWNLE